MTVGELKRMLGDRDDRRVVVLVTGEEYFKLDVTRATLCSDWPPDGMGGDDINANSETMVQIEAEL